MVVVQDHAGRVGEEGTLQDLARLDDGPVERSAVDLGIVAQEAVAGVQVESAGALLGAVAAHPAEVVLDEGGLVEEVAPTERLGGEPAGELERRRDGGGPRALDTALAGELRLGEPREAGQAPVRREQAPGAIEGALASRARDEEEGEQLLAREGARAQSGEPLARAIFEGKILDAEKRTEAVSVMAIRRGIATSAREDRRSI
jgi:hypothetical protein